MTKKDNSALSSKGSLIPCLAVAYILVGHFAISKLIVVFSHQARPTLLYSLGYASILCIAIIYRFVSGKLQTHFSPMLLLMVLLTLAIVINNPYTEQSLDKLFFFLALVFLPCIYLCLCNIPVERLSRVFFFCSIFFCVILATASYYYLSGGKLSEVLTDKEQYSKLFSIGIAQYLGFACFFFYFFAKKTSLSLFVRTVSLILLLVTFASLLLLGERQALVAVFGAPLILIIIRLRKPGRTILALLTAAVLFLAIFSTIMPYILKEGPLRHTRMGEFLVTKYYDEKNLETLNGRIQLYKTALTVSMENPFTGVGFSRFGEYVSKKYNLRMIKTDLDPHNLWLLIVAELGVVGLILTSMIFLFFVKSIWVCRNAHRVDKSAEIELCSLMSISVLLFSIVSLAWRSSFIFFSTAILMEQASRYLSQRNIESRPPV